MDRQALTVEQQAALDKAKQLLKRDKSDAEDAHIKALHDAYKDFNRRLEDAGIDTEGVDWLNDA